MNPDALQEVSEANVLDQRGRILEKAIVHYGENKQLLKLAEECSELVTAICKYKLNPNDENYGNVMEESVDVGIVLEQFFDNVYLPSFVQNVEICKLKRLDKQIDYEQSR